MMKFFSAQSLKNAVLFCVLSLGFFNSNAQVNTTDSLALVALYEATDGDNWVDRQNWLTGPVGSWQFVDVEDNRVIRVIFPGENNLKGQLPPEIGSFTAIDWLGFNGQSGLTGSIPDEIGNLTTLRFLTFTNNGLSGQIPASISNLPLLINLSFQGNQFTGLVPSGLNTLENLRTLDLDDNLLESMPDFTGHPELFRLDASENRFGFKELIKNLNVDGFRYKPQKELTSDTVYILAPGSDITIDFDTAGISADFLTWTEQSDTVELGTNALAIENITLDPSKGQINETTYRYQLVMTSQAIPDLTLKTGQFILVVPQTRPVDRKGAVTFKIDETHYMGLGKSEWGYLRDLSRFNENQSAINWEDMNVFPGEPRAEAVSFVLGSHAYVGTGIGVDDSLYQDFYRYTPATNSWDRIADFPGGARYNAVAFSTAGYGYVGTGRTTDDEQADFWRYDPEKDEWNEVAESPAGKRQGAFTFTVRDRAFVGGGFYRDDFTFFQQSDVYEYDPEINEWIERVFADGINLSINEARAFSLYDHGYIWAGNKTDLIKYNPFDHTYENLGNVFGLEAPVKDPFAIALPELAYLPTDSFGYPYNEFETVFYTYEEENIPMSDFTLTGSTVPENNDSVTFVGVLSVTDPDQYFPHSYGTSSERFFVSHDSVYTKAVFDHEERSGYSDLFWVDDNRDNRLFSNPAITVADVNEAPTDISLTNNTVAEADGFTEIGRLTATDEDFGDTFTYTIAEEDRDMFSFAGTDRIMIENSDFETASEVTVTVTATDEGGLTFTKELEITITNVNEPPTAINLSNKEIDVESIPGTVVGTLSSDDPEDSDGFTYTIVNDVQEFEIEDQQLVTTTALNNIRGFIPEIVVEVKTSDPGGLEFQEAISIMLFNITDAALPATMKVFPNPAGNFLIITDQLKEEKQISLTDVNGKMLYSRSYEGVENATVKLHEFPAGIYLLTITTPGQTRRIRVIKE